MYIIDIFYKLLDTTYGIIAREMFIYSWNCLVPSVEKPLTLQLKVTFLLFLNFYSPKNEFELVFMILKKGSREPVNYLTL